MDRQKNYARGSKGEKRIIERLQEIGEVSSSGKRYPDLILKHNGSVYGIECKSVLGVHSGGRMGVAKITSTEMHGMNELIDGEIIPCLIVEIRPKGRGPKSYLFIDWEKVREKYSKTTPGQLSLTFWWILKNGIKLDSWRNSQTIQGGENT